MNTIYKFCLSVECPDGRCFAFTQQVDAFSAPQLRPYDLCDNALMGMASVNGVLHMGALRIDADRKRLAKQVAEILTENILNAIKKQDTKNGYEQQHRIKTGMQ